MRREVSYTTGVTVKTPRHGTKSTRSNKAHTPATDTSLVHGQAWQTGSMSLQRILEKLEGKSPSTAGVMEAKTIVTHAINMSLCSGISAAATLDDCMRASKVCGLNDRGQKRGMVMIERMIRPKA